jgi:DNA-binding XRE family transcriptional regulator
MTAESAFCAGFGKARMFVRAAAFGMWGCSSHRFVRYFKYQPARRDLSILKISIRQIKAARALLEWTQKRLAAVSGISIPTIRRLEARGGELGGRDETASKIVTALEAAGVEFTNGDQPGVRLRKQ